MACRFVLTTVLFAISVIAARAADLPAQTRLGALFAEPPQPRIVERRPLENSIAVVVDATSSPRVPGYYGRRGDFAYHSYYGTPSDVIFNRLPYACHFYGSC